MIVQKDGWWWPEADTAARKVILRDVDRDIPALLEHVEGRTCIVQAGGNVGVYPLALADHFRRVITFEPDPENVACLWKNLFARDSFKRVDARQAALGADHGTCGMVVVEAENCGAHRIEPDAGQIVVYPIDSLDLIACDAIWLDVEGFELAALQGAVETLKRFSPVVAFEDKGLDARYGVAPGATAAWVEARGYQEVARFGRDRVFKKVQP